MSYHRTADRLFDACLLDIYPEGSAVYVDFSLDERTYPHYQRAIKTGKVTADQLHKAAGDGKKLTALIGCQVKTMFDMF
jgi:hypothetical protein